MLRKNQDSGRVSMEPLESRAYFSVVLPAAAAGTVDFGVAVSISSPKNDQVLPGKTFGLAIDVTNNGTGLASGPLLIDVGLTLAAVPGTDIHTDSIDSVISIAAPTAHIHIAPGKQQTIHLSEKIPLGFDPGSYLAEVTIDPNNTFGETGTTNNSAQGSATLTVLDPYPNLLGTFTGPDLIKKGPSKGAKPTVALDFVSESLTTGAITADGTLFSSSSTSSFNFSGTISTKGVFAGIGSSSKSPFTAAYHGKFSKNVLTGTVSNTDGNSGTFTLKRTV